MITLDIGGGLSVVGKGSGKHPEPGREVARNIGHWLAWWALLAALWLLLTGSFDPYEMGAGAVAAAVAATTATLVKAESVMRFDPEIAWLLRAVRLPRRIFVDNLVVLGAAVRHVTGRRRAVGAFRAVRFRTGGEDSRSATRRALVISAITVTPNTYVVGVDKDRDLILCHQLVPARPEDARKEILEWMSTSGS
ncbi:MAG: Na+/H+ antiporter subunit E [Actinomycetota bacterium]|nr:Na+/H+ antiporter subunit E [Actinomycetota bacterium]